MAFVLEALDAKRNHINDMPGEYVELTIQLTFSYIREVEDNEEESYRLEERHDIGDEGRLYDVERFYFVHYC